MTRKSIDIGSTMNKTCESEQKESPITNHEAQAVSDDSKPIEDSTSTRDLESSTEKHKESTNDNQVDEAKEAKDKTKDEELLEVEYRRKSEDHKAQTIFDDSKPVENSTDTKDLQSSPEKSEESTNDRQADEAKQMKDRTNDEEVVEVEYRRKPEDQLEIIKDTNSCADLREARKQQEILTSSGLSRSNSFSVKEEIEKIEKQIKDLEEINTSKDIVGEESDRNVESSLTRQSIQENRRSFFKNMVNDDAVKIEIKEFPRMQKNIHIIQLTDPQPKTDTKLEMKKTSKAIELHISEPIEQHPELFADVNPIPKPQRNNSLSLEAKPSSIGTLSGKNTSDTRGNSL